MTSKLYRLTATIETYYYSANGEHPSRSAAWRVVQDSMVDGGTMALAVRPVAPGDDLIEDWSGDCLVYGDHEGELRLDEVMP